MLLEEKSVKIDCETHKAFRVKFGNVSFNAVLREVCGLPPRKMLKKGPKLGSKKKKK